MPTPTHTATLAELLADGDPEALGGEVRHLLGLDDGPTALYAAGVTECATYAAWEAAGQPGDYPHWLGSLPQPFLHAMLALAAGAADDEARALHTIAACSAALRAVAVQIGH
ncbi:hypothetical protein ACFV4P_03065 [Kitasatospora sp. NPDC059795]|uniref:hypothetical protein n=1 Tax=Kitasatospora sp. NPDC059795 TaxID=3346949 RepID=UPI00364A4771